MRGSLARRGFVVLGVFASLVLGGSAALAAIPSTSGTVYACYSKTTGAMRVVNYPTVRCTSAEKMIDLASANVTARHVAGNFFGSAGNGLDGSWHGMFLFQIDATPSGALRFGYYTTTTTAPSEWSGTRTQGTVDTLRFFTAASGAPAAEFTGWECLLAKGAAATDPLGTCSHYRIIVSDGASVRLADTFCGGNADVTDPNQPAYCPYTWNVEKGDIRIYSGA